MMNVFLSGSPVTLTLPLADRYGSPIAPSAIEYHVVKQDGSEVVSRAALPGFSEGMAEVTIEIPASVNALPAIDVMSLTSAQADAALIRETRKVELFLTVNGGTVVLSSTYALERADALIEGLNSFQTFEQAELTALDIPNMIGWASATTPDKIAALVDARLGICQLRFVMLGNAYGQDSLNYVIEGARTVSNIGGSIGVDLSAITPAEYARLPQRFKTALCRAQVAQADAVLGGDPIDIKRQEGLILDTIGESKQMFRSGKPLNLPISRRALKYLSPFVSFSKILGR